MTITEQDKAKYREVIDTVLGYVTGNISDYQLVKNAFDEYFEWHEKQAEAGHFCSLGGRSFSVHNRIVLAIIMWRGLFYNLHNDSLFCLDTWESKYLYNESHAAEARAILEGIAMKPEAKEN